MNRRQKSEPRPQPASPVKTWVGNLVSKLLVIGLCLGGAYLMGTMGRDILKTGKYNYTLETSSGGSRSTSSDRNLIRREEVHATGSWAREQAFGFLATAATLTFWAFLILWSMAGPLSLRVAWSPVHSILTAISLAGCGTTVFHFFPPWRIGWSMSCNAFYFVVAAFLYLAVLNDRDKVRSQSQKVFPALIASAVLIGTFFSGYLIGIIAGIFIGLLLATHILLLIPKMRAELWIPEL